jgi:hypothetical protein
VDHHIGLGIALSVAVAGHMRATIKHRDLVTCFGQLIGDDCAGEAGAYDCDFLHFILSL